MTTTEAADRLLEWVLEIAGPDSELADDGIQGGYRAEPLEKTVALPDVIVEITGHKRGRAGDDPRFPQWNIQQRALLMTWDVTLSIMVDIGETAEQNLEAADQLRNIADRVLDAIWEDVKLGGRFDGSAIETEANFTPGFVRYPDGVTGRDVRIDLTVAEIVR